MGYKYLFQILKYKIVKDYQDLKFILISLYFSY